MKICFLSSCHPALDKRVFAKEAVTLARAGHEVIHLAPASEVREWTQDGVRVMTYPDGRGGVLPSRLRRLPTLFRRAAAVGANAYHCNEMDSWLVGIALKIAMRCAIVFDVHEHYPSDFSERRFPRWARPAIAGLIRLMFVMLTPFTDRLVMAKKAIDDDFPAPSSRKVLVENFADLTYSTTRLTAEHAGNGQVVAIHIGEMGVVRGWPQMLDAIKILDDHRLIVEMVGKFSDGSGEAFSNRVQELGLESRVRVAEWMPFADVYQRILAADIGLVLFQPGLMNHVLALPHKMFDYMMAGLPVIAPGFAVEVAAIIRDADCGVLVDPSKPEEIAAALRRLLGSAEERSRLGQNGRRGVLQKYNWDAEGRKLLQMYDEMSVSARA